MDSSSIPQLVQSIYSGLHEEIICPMPLQGLKLACYRERRIFGSRERSSQYLLLFELCIEDGGRHRTAACYRI